MSELDRTDGTGGTVAAAGAGVMDVVSFGIVVIQLALAGARLRGLSGQVRATYRYVDGCSRRVDRLADQMAGLEVDADTVGEHHQAAALMRAVLEEADALAAATEDLSTLFDQTAAAHQNDYGTVADAASNMIVPMADASFYSNR
ncbi:hypothetical protein GT755_38115 [Herbidospora sp. NEAU-GS84]|uniref:Uncharacterized protein n=1 Tax=Herbidospora solisilvae TaxID=2696284 RepID=A0A7C9N652_9ACTN|nr:hypothetical protein [Herbidospora solisilvae]NAS27470.1 hypothetical protein [Herbidospora solisilvae]